MPRLLDASSTNTAELSMSNTDRHAANHDGFSRALHEFHDIQSSSSSSRHVSDGDSPNKKEGESPRIQVSSGVSLSEVVGDSIDAGGALRSAGLKWHIVWESSCSSSSSHSDLPGYSDNGSRNQRSFVSSCGQEVVSTNVGGDSVVVMGSHRAGVGEPSSSSSAPQVRNPPVGDVGEPSVLSIGSAMHSQNRCRPCRFLKMKGGCRNGYNCIFCHHSHETMAWCKVSKLDRLTIRNLCMQIHCAETGDARPLQGARAELYSLVSGDERLSAYSTSVLRSLKQGKTMHVKGSEGLDQSSTEFMVPDSFVSVPAPYAAPTLVSGVGHASLQQCRGNMDAWTRISL